MKNLVLLSCCLVLTSVSQATAASEENTSGISSMNDYSKSAVYEIKDEPGFPRGLRTQISEMNDDEQSPVYSREGNPGFSDSVGLSRREFEQRRYGRSPAVRSSASSGAPRAAESDEVSSTTGASADNRDMRITQQIRRKIMSADDLSTRAQNLLVVSEGGKVTLRGTVPSAEEKSKVEKMARAVNGVETVDTSEVRISQEKRRLK
jgi:hyperosmotically inducible periplasmic protein